MTGMNMCRKARLRMCSGLVRRKTRKGRDGATAENYGYSIVEMISHLKGKNS